MQVINLQTKQKVFRATDRNVSGQLSRLFYLNPKKIYHKVSHYEDHHEEEEHKSDSEDYEAEVNRF